MKAILTFALIFSGSATLAAGQSSKLQSLTIVGPDADELAEVIRRAGGTENKDTVTFLTSAGGLKITCNHTGFVPVCAIQKVATY